MRIVVALGGNALLQRGQAMTAENQMENIKGAACSLAKLAKDHQIVVAHGSGPQVGLLTLQTSAFESADREPYPYPLEVLGAETVGQIGYMLEQQLGNLLPKTQNYATLLTQIEVTPHDVAFDNPTRFIGPLYTKEVADEVATQKGFKFKQEGEYWRRVVASPLPQRIFEVDVIRTLIEHDVIVICAGGGGIPTTYDTDGNLKGVEAIIDKDRAAALLAREVDANVLLILTDVDSVYLDWGTENQRSIRYISPNELEKFSFPAESMGPKVEVAIEFARQTGGIACIGNLYDALELLAGTAGTTVTTHCVEAEYL